MTPFKGYLDFILILIAYFTGILVGYSIQKKEK